MDDNRDTAYDARTSAGYVEVDDRVGWALGYPFALRALGVGGPDAPETLLDYGCGPGKVAERIARRYGLQDYFWSAPHLRGDPGRGRLYRAADRGSPARGGVRAGRPG